MRKLLIAAVAALLATPAMAQVNFQTSVKGYHYFHKTGATMAAHDDAVINCVRIVRGLALTGGDYWAGMVGMGLDGMHTEFAVPANIEHCMVAWGWEVMQLDEADGRALAAKPREARYAALSEWVGSPTPKGRVARRFVNDLTDPATVWDGRSWGSEKTSLSRSALPDFNENPPPVPRRELPKTAWPLRPLKAKEIAALPADASVVVIRFTAPNMKSFRGSLIFNRAGPDPFTPAWVDGDPSSFAAGPEGREKVVVFRVPPGKWRFAGLSSVYGVTAFCHGAPSFQVAPGQAVFAGTFTQGVPGQLVPDLDMAPLAARLPDAQALRDRLQPARWTNGSWERCGGAYTYAFEIPGAPFEEGYTGGSKGLVAP